jgi:hypothetical protein
MARLNYNINWFNELTDPGAQSPNLRLMIIANKAGVAKCRFYLDGDTPGAFVTMPIVGAYPNSVILSVATGKWVVEYQDDNGSRILAKIDLIPFAGNCFNIVDSPTYEEKGSTGSVAVRDTYVQVSNTVSFGATNPGLHSRAWQASIDGGSTYKSGVSSVQWSDTEMSALGLNGSIALLKIKRTSNACSMNQGSVIYIDTPVIPELLASYSKSNATAFDVCDGTINTSVSGGLPPYTYLWGDGPTTPNRTGLCQGIYSVTITDSNATSVVLSGIEITEPSPPVPEPPQGSFLEVPMMNSLRFVHRVTPNGCSVFQNFDNTLLCEEEHPYFDKTNYYQKVAQCDTLPIQFFSDFSSHEIQLRRYGTDEVVKSFIATMKMEFLGQSQTFGIYITDHGGGQSRVYFNIGAFPITIVAGDTFAIKNNGDGFNGNYAVVSIQNDVLLGAQYLVINKSYSSPDPSSTADAEFAVEVLSYNIFETNLGFGDVAIGQYYMRIAGISDTPKELVSEPIDVQVIHEECNLIEVRGFDNSQDMIWQTGITSRRRVESWFQQRFVRTKRTTTRDCDGSLTKVSAQKFRRPKLQFVKLPPYLYEWLNVGLDLDLIRINGVEYQTDTDMSDPKYLTRYQLADFEQDMEQKNWFSNENSDDLGDVDGDLGFIIVNDSLLKY